MLIIGSGLLARSFEKFQHSLPGVCIYAAGVSNSSCADANEFLREEKRLSKALAEVPLEYTFTYFGTCSIGDPDAQKTEYVQHKLAMEKMVAGRASYLICRLPQVAGKTPNPNTLLNYLYAKISRSEAFSLWSKARRNIIDVDDVADIVYQALVDREFRNTILNIANPVCHSMFDIVKAMERVVGKSAIYYATERGTSYTIDTQRIQGIAEKKGIDFGDNYLDRVLDKYYGPLR
jgi:nucleoside-diphosphate-sugar epimerase